MPYQGAPRLGHGDGHSMTGGDAGSVRQVTHGRTRFLLLLRAWDMAVVELTRAGFDAWREVRIPTHGQEVEAPVAGDEGLRHPLREVPHRGVRRIERRPVDIRDVGPSRAVRDDDEQIDVRAWPGPSRHASTGEQHRTHPRLGADAASLSHNPRVDL